MGYKLSFKTFSKVEGCSEYLIFSLERDIYLNTVKNNSSIDEDELVKRVYKI